MVRPTRVEIDLGAIAHNVTQFIQTIRPAAMCAVVKADGYGHGDVPVAEAALNAGADWIAVALVEEGIRLREAGLTAPILVLSEPNPDAAVDILNWDLTPSVYSQPFIEALADHGKPTDVHLKIDTGMHRVGAKPEQIEELVQQVRQSSTLNLAALWTHFSVADEDSTYTNLQIERFLEVTARYDVPTTHLANTAGAVCFPQARADMCRIGLGMYGLHPSQATQGLIDLKPAMRMVSQVTHLQRLPAGARPSYGRIRPLPADANVAVVPVGYADGYPRGLTGEVLIGGQRHPLAGRVTMDQILVDVGDSDVKIGDEVILLGPQGSEEVTAEEWATDLGTITWEIVCTVGPRVPRSYLT